MREAFKPLWQLLKVALLLAIAAYPAAFIVQLFSKSSKPFDQYNQIIGHVFSTYWDWMIVISLSIIFLRSDLLFKTVEHIRNRHYELEHKRWVQTPYIAPLHLLYLLAPPGAITDDKESNAFDPLYKKVVNDFRDRVYVNAKYTSFEPDEKPGFWSILGRQVTSQLIVNTIMISFGVCGMLYLNLMTEQLSGWGKAFIPLVVFFLARNIYLIQAIRMAHPAKTYRRIQLQFGQEEPKITWRELFPDMPYGESILFAWRADCEKRQRLAYELSNKPVPVKMEFTSPGLAPKPFPAEEIPVWTENAERMYEDQHMQWRRLIETKNKQLEKASQGKVIAFRKKSR